LQAGRRWFRARSLPATLADANASGLVPPIAVRTRPIAALAAATTVRPASPPGTRAEDACSAAPRSADRPGRLPGGKAARSETCHGRTRDKTARSVRRLILECLPDCPPR